MIDPHDAAMDTFEYHLRPVIEALVLGPDENMPVIFYGYKDTSNFGDPPQVKRPCVIVQQILLADGDVPRIAGGPYPYVGRTGVVVYIETPFSVKGEDASGLKDFGGYDYLLGPICNAFVSWFHANPALVVPDEFRLNPDDTADPVLFAPEVLDMRRATTFRVPLRSQEFLRTSYYPILEYIQGTGPGG